MSTQQHPADRETERAILVGKYPTLTGVAERDQAYDNSTRMNEPTEIELGAPRRSKRRSSAISPTKPTTSTLLPHAAFSEVAQTPPRRKQKRARFSDSAVQQSRYSTTGLTPYVQRSTLDTPSRSSSSPLPISGEFQFTPFRQVLDARCRRRIRRNGLSEEMNDYEAERKDKARLEKEVQAKDEELKRLRTELEASRRTSAHTQDDEISSSQYIDEVEAELEALRQSFNEDDAVYEDDAMVIDWSQIHAGTIPGPRSEGGDTIPIYEDEDSRENDGNAVNIQQDPDLLGMVLDLESAKHEKRRLFRDVRKQLHADDMNLADSPGRAQLFSDSLQSLPSPPQDFYQNLSKTLKATTNRAEEAEVALHSLEAEVKSLGFVGGDASTSITEIANQFRAARLELERAMPGETTTGFENTQIIPEILQKLKTLICQVGDREAELKSMREQQKTLKGNFDHAIHAAEKASIRAKELEESIDTGAEEMLEVRMKVQALERDNAEKDKTVASLINALEKYRKDVSRLEGLLTQLESDHFSLIAVRDTTKAEHEQQVSDLDAKVAAEVTGRRAAEQSAVDRLSKIEDLEQMLATTQSHSQDVEAQLRALERRNAEEASATSQQLGGLNSRISNLSTALASANAEVDKLKITKKKLEEKFKFEVEQSQKALDSAQSEAKRNLIQVKFDAEQAQKAIDSMQFQAERNLIKVSEKRKSYVRSAKVRIANSEIEDENLYSDGTEGPMTPASLVRFVDVDDDDHVDGAVAISRGKGRVSGGLGLVLSHKGRRARRCDGRIGMDTLSEDDAEEEWEDSEADMLTPDLSSEADFDVDLEIGSS